MAKSQWVRLGVLWRGEKKNVLTGQLNGLLGEMLQGRRIVLLPNDKKEEENQPDYILSLAPADDDDDDRGGRG